jgi:hypothetical protein
VTDCSLLRVYASRSTANSWLFWTRICETRSLHSTVTGQSASTVNWLQIMYVLRRGSTSQTQPMLPALCSHRDKQVGIHIFSNSLIFHFALSLRWLK